MKKAVLIPVIILASALPSCIMGDWNNGISGDGHVVTEVINVDGFTGVHASSGIDVTIAEGAYYVEVVADANLQEHITVEREGSMLRIGSKRNIYRAESKVVNVTLPELDAIKISSAGDVETLTPFKCEELDIDISSAGDLDMTKVEAESVDIHISSSGDCDISGRTINLFASLSSAGDLNARDLESDYAKVSVSSAGDARVFANEEISMTASSAGSIYHYGDAKVIKSSTSSAGSIVKK